MSSTHRVQVQPGTLDREKPSGRRIAAFIQGGRNGLIGVPDTSQAGDEARKQAGRPYAEGKKRVVSKSETPTGV
ncbi:MAG TPA: hypothetical protein VIA07_08785 [Desulfuromonadales bacterium]